jgi:TonB family protein
MVGCSSEQAAAGAISLPEGRLRTLVRSSVPLTLPETRPEPANGVIVAEVVVDTDGHVATVSVVESPNQVLNTAVVKALSQWRFEPFRTKTGRVRLRSKLTFYCVLKDGQTRALSPAEAPYRD